MLEYGVAQSNEDLKQIIALQRANEEAIISEIEAREQGFVTVHHSLDLLSRMNYPHPHIIVKDGSRVVGYSLVMQRSFAVEIEILAPMFEKIYSLEYQGKSLNDSSFFIMGQVCIAKSHRGKGIFYGLYDKMKEEMKAHFECVITEVAVRNQRSLKAHYKAGFQNILEYNSPDGEEWILLLWDWC